MNDKQTEFSITNLFSKKIPLFSDIIEVANDPIILASAKDGIIIDVNSKMCKLLSYTREELIGQAHTIIHPVKFRKQYKEDFSKETHKNALPREVILVDKYGKNIPAEVNASIFLLDNEIEIKIGIFRDLRERNKKDEELIKLKTAVEQSPDAIVITNIKGIIEYVNPAFTKITGYSYEEAIGSNPNVLKSGYHDKTFYENLWENLLNKKSWSGRFYNKKKNGQCYWEKATISPITDTRGIITKFLAIKEDITRQIENENKITSDNERFKILSKSSARLFNCKTIKEIYNYVGSILTLLHNDIIIVFMPVIDNGKNLKYDSTHGLKESIMSKIFTQIGQSLSNTKYPVVNDLHELYPFGKLTEYKEGFIDFFGMTFPPSVTQAAQKLLGVEKVYGIGINNNYSLHTGINIFCKKGEKIENPEFIEILIQQASTAIQRKLLEEELINARDQAEQANNTKNIFLANISHELRTPLHAILGVTGALHQKNAFSHDKNLRDGLLLINESGDRLLTLINDILNLTKIEEGKSEIAHEEIRLADFLNYHEHLAQNLIGNKPVIFNILQLDPLPECIISDKEKLTLIITNLLSNAVKFTDEGSINLTIGIENETLYISISDTGIGIPQKDQKNIFTKFFRVQKHTNKYNGTGIGLALVKSMTELLHGTIDFKSQSGKGTKFNIHIPFTKCTHETSNASALIINHTSLLDELLPDAIIEIADLYFDEYKVRIHDIDTAFEAGDAEQCRFSIHKFKGSFKIFRAERVVIIMQTIEQKLENEGITDEVTELYNIALQEIEIFNEELSKVCELLQPNERQKNNREKTKTLLIADDEKIGRAAMNIMLGDHYNIIFAENGFDAIEKFKTEKPDLVLLDIMMPECDGYQALDEMKQINDNNIPILAATAIALPSEKEALLKAGFDDYLIKPIRLNELFAMLKHYFSQ